MLVKSTMRLASAPGGQDHTISPSTPVALVARNRSCPSQPASTFVTTRTPLRRGGMYIDYHDFRKKERTIFFAPGLDMTELLERWRKISVSA
jgi:hypothetical protein